MLGSLATELPSPFPPCSDSLTSLIPQIPPDPQTFYTCLGHQPLCLGSQQVGHVFLPLHPLCPLWSLTSEKFSTVEFSAPSWAYPPQPHSCTALLWILLTGALPIMALTGWLGCQLCLLNYFFNVYFISLTPLELCFGMGDLCTLLVVACGIQFPNQGLNLSPLLWECGVLATGGNSLLNYFN